MEQAMLLPDVTQDRQNVRLAIRKARMITGMVQGTMSLEGQGLDKKTLRKLNRRTLLDILGRTPDSQQMRPDLLKIFNARWEHNKPGCMLLKDR
jgi:hypothetical protein